MPARVWCVPIVVVGVAHVQRIASSSNCFSYVDLTRLQARARVKLAEVDAKLVELTTVRDTLRAALDAGCDDLIACADSPCCPLPFVVSIPVGGLDA